MMIHVLIKLVLLWITYKKSHQCRETCLDCRNGTLCYGCKDGYYVQLQKCIKCSDGCAMCKHSHIDCSACMPGHWGDWCQYSCIPCGDCSNSYCTRNCRDDDPSWCFNSPCPYKCSFRFTGRRKNHSVSSTPKTDGTTLSASKRKVTPFMEHGTTTKQSDGTVYFEQPGEKARYNEDGTTEQPETKTDGLDPTVVYIVINVVGVFVLTVAAVIVVVVCIKRRNSCQDQVTCFQDANNKAESRQVAHNARGDSNVSHHDNAIRSVATINVAESDTGYVDMNTIANVASINIAGSNTGNVDLNTIDTIASINASGSNTGNVDLNATAYVNVVDKPDVNATDTVNEYEDLNPYTNVREAENQYTSLSGNANVYYSVLD